MADGKSPLVDIGELGQGGTGGSGNTGLPARMESSVLDNAISPGEGDMGAGEPDRGAIMWMWSSEERREQLLHHGRKSKGESMRHA
jgi:hypothetical protein